MSDEVDDQYFNRYDILSLLTMVNRSIRYEQSRSTANATKVKRLVALKGKLEAWLHDVDSGVLT